MQQKSRGYTLLELMTMTAVLGIIAAIALPIYRTYIGRAEAAAALGTIASMRAGVEQALSSGKNTLVLTDIGMSAGANYMGTIQLLYSNDPSSFTQILFTFGASSPNTLGKAIALYRYNSDPQWYCSSTLNAEYKPKNC